MYGAAFALHHPAGLKRIPTGHTQSPSLHLKDQWLREAGFDTGTGVTDRILVGFIVLMADSNEVQELREELYQAKQVVRGIKDASVWCAKQRQLNRNEPGRVNFFPGISVIREAIYSIV